jgi:thymidylate kinase
MSAKPANPIVAEGEFDSFGLPAFAPKDAGVPVIVAIEGPNGAGKTTLSWALSRKLGVPWALGTDETWFAEPLKVRMIRDADWWASAMFFLSGCFEQMRLLRKRSDRAIIMDRCLWSTLAVQAADNTQRLQALIEMIRPVGEHIRIPQVTLVLEASFATCQERISNKTGTARALDQLTANAKFHAREREFYFWLARQTPTVCFLETDHSNADEVAAKALAVLKPKLAGIYDI